MKLIAKALLWIITVAVPVVIAACYGMPYRFYSAGRVVDNITKEGVAGMLVKCGHVRNAWADPLRGTTVSVSETMSDGYFSINYDDPCDWVFIEDGTPDRLGGIYESKEAEFCDECEEDQWVIEVQR